MERCSAPYARRALKFLGEIAATRVYTFTRNRSTVRGDGSGLRNLKPAFAERRGGFTTTEPIFAQANLPSPRPKSSSPQAKRSSKKRRLLRQTEDLTQERKRG